MCTVLLPPGVNTITANRIYQYQYFADGQFGRNMQHVLGGLIKLVVDGGKTYVRFYVTQQNGMNFSKNETDYSFVSFDLHLT